MTQRPTFCFFTYKNQNIGEVSIAKYVNSKCARDIVVDCQWQLAIRFSTSKNHNMREVTIALYAYSRCLNSEIFFIIYL